MSEEITPKDLQTVLNLGSGIDGARTFLELRNHLQEKPNSAEASVVCMMAKLIREFGHIE